MRIEILNWLNQLFKNLTGKLSNSGNNSLQAGKVGGNIINIHSHTTNYHTHTSTSPNPVIEPELKPKKKATPEQVKVLLLMREHNLDEVITKFTFNNFGTKKIIDLDDQQLYRTQKYLEACIKKGSK